MKKHTFIRVLGLAVLACLQVSAVSPALASGNDAVQPRYVHMRGLNADVVLTEFSRADCYSTVETMRIGDTAALTMELQRSSDGSAWSPVASWSTIGSGLMSLGKSRYVTSGYYYRVVASASVYDSAGTLMESESVVSKIVP